MGYNKIGLIGAMNEEIERILEHMDQTNKTVKAGIVYYEGKFAGKSVVLCKSGVGKVNAAVCTQILIDRFGVDSIIFTGVAGAVDPTLDIGDIVVSSTCLQHDVDATALGFARGVIPFQEVSEYAADAKLVEAACNAGEKLYGKFVKGKVLSGDQFVASREAVKSLYDELSGACTEMEGASVAQVCHMYGTPFVIIRSMSDKADGSAHVNFAEFTVVAADRSYRIVEEMLGQL